MNHAGVSRAEWPLTDMDESEKLVTGGCLCGALRYEARGEPQYAGLCYCGDCCRASGSAFIAFMGFPGSAVRFSGATRQTRSQSARGSDAVRNFCAICSSLVFGGVVGQDQSHTIYAGSLDDPTQFQPRMAIFAANRPAWCAIPEGLTVFDRMPGG
ncbi:MAG TPA: GFA family protein [Rhizomicrobium sp.]|jgi:hypothetical protein